MAEVIGEVRRRLEVHIPGRTSRATAIDQSRSSDGHALAPRMPRRDLRKEVLHDHLLHVTVSGVARGDRPERVQAVLAALADPDEDPGRERDAQLSSSFERGQPARRLLVGSAAMAVERAVERLDHHALAGRGRPQQRELALVERPGVGMRQQPRLGDDDLSACGEVVDGGRVPVLGEPPGGFLVPELGPLAQREQRLVTSDGSARPRDREDLVDREVRRTDPSRGSSERAVPARIATQVGQRDEHLRRVRDTRTEPLVAHGARLAHQLLEGRRKELVIGRVQEHPRTVAVVSSESELGRLAGTPDVHPVDRGTLVQ